jgi:hypothetical protein
MSKIQTIVSLLIFLIVLFSMDLIFGNPLRESFTGVAWNKGLGVGMGKSGIGRGVGIGGVGGDLGYRTIVTHNSLNGNMNYPNGNQGSGFLAAKIPNNYKLNSDDQPVHFSFPR